MAAIAFDNSYARLPERFFSRRQPTPVADPGPVRVNHPLATLLGIAPQWLESPEGTAVLAGNAIAPGSEPIATVYAGHQFGSYNPQLGDGRALLLGEVIGADGTRYDIQLKGSGPTPYSRGGDGRAPLGAVLREYIVSEAMHTLGLPTTRALAAVTTGEQVARESFLPGAVLCRVARSHIRIGTFQFFAARRDTEALELLVAHVLERHYPDAAGDGNPALALLQRMITAQACLVARWQSLGFIHGVMNTDNMLLSGETIDYGPCAFMDAFNRDQVYSSIDHAGRYAFGNQPAITHWNLAALAQALLPVLHPDQDQAVALAQAAVDAFPGQFAREHGQCLARKLGLAVLADGDQALADELFQLMEEHQLDFTLTFRRLADLAGSTPGGDGATPGAGTTVEALFEVPDPLLPWLARWQQRLAAEQTTPGERQAVMYSANPVFIPRNHLVEEALRAATEQGDFEPFNALVDVLSQPFAYNPERARFATPPRPEQVVRQTFCGT
ncbi:MAG: YdiU family protein [Halioglobus sp.]|nr:YdiU family protein [Halioglobus sp.]